MSSHALPPERGTRARAGIWWRQARRGVPLLAAVVTARLMVGNLVPGDHGIAALARTAGASVLAFAACLVVFTGLDGYARKLSGALAGPRPRWQYLLFAAGYAGATVPALMFAATRVGPIANIVGTIGLWAAAASLVLLGRAVVAGRGRRFLWRYPPAGIAPGQPVQPTAPGA